MHSKEEKINGLEKVEGESLLTIGNIVYIHIIWALNGIDSSHTVSVKRPPYKMLR